MLKVDIEGSEFEALTSFIDAHAVNGEPLPVGQLQLEIHVNDKSHEHFNFFNSWWLSLEAAGLRPFWTEANLVYLNRYRGVAPDISEVVSLSCIELTCC